MFDILLFLFLLSLVAFIIGIIKPTLFIKGATRKKTALILGSVVLALFTAAAITSPKQTNTQTAKSTTSTTPTNEPTKVIPTSSPAPTKKISLKYERLGYKDAGNVENLYYLYTDTDKSEGTLNQVVKQIKEKDCKKPCNISIYDDKKAYAYDNARRAMTDKQTLDDWNKQYYVYVADHLLVTQTFDTKEPWHFPLKDWYYKELKSE